jgi:hypothetical protein
MLVKPGFSKSSFRFACVLVSKPPAFFASQHFLAVVELVVEPAETLPRHHWSKAKFAVKFNQVGDGVFFWQWVW